MASLKQRPQITVACIAQQDNRYLLIEERIKGNTVINQPAGRIELSESAEKAVIRETLEETAWACQPQYITGLYCYHTPDGNKTFYRICFFCHLLKHHPQQPLDEGILAARFYTKDEIKQASYPTRSPLVLRCIEDYESGQRYPLDLIPEILHE